MPISRRMDKEVIPSYTAPWGWGSCSLTPFFSSDETNCILLRNSPLELINAGFGDGIIQATWSCFLYPFREVILRFLIVFCCSRSLCGLQSSPRTIFVFGWLSNSWSLWKDRVWGLWLCPFIGVTLFSGYWKDSLLSSSLSHCSTKYLINRAVTRGKLTWI